MDAFNDWSTIQYFKPSEFDSPDAPGSGANMNLGFVRKLDKLREAVKRPLKILSGYRTPEHNATLKDSVDDSAHTTGHAADIECLTSGERYSLLEAAYRLGFRRIGIGHTFAHFDDDITKPQDVNWDYVHTVTRNT